MGQAQWTARTSRKLLAFACVTTMVVASCAGYSASTRPGSYPYFCDRHQSMRGEIFVREFSGGNMRRAAATRPMKAL
jgi:hypothetical protein